MEDDTDDFIGVSYIELLNKSLNRCIIDWKCFTERSVSETNRNNLRIALIQYCRGQREIFLKLKVLFDLTKYQKSVDKLLQYSTQYDQYIEKSVQDLSKNICVIENNIMPAPNVTLSVDLLNSFSYTRIPSMIGEISKSSVDNTIPVMKIDPETIDLCLNRLQLHFYVMFKLSNCSSVCKVDFNNGVCHFVRENFFHIELLYDFSQYQITKLKFFINNNYVTNIVNIMNFILNHHLTHKTKASSVVANTAKEVTNNKSDRKLNNIFDIIYIIINRYIGKLIMKHLYNQVVNYNNNKYIIYNYDHTHNVNSTKLSEVSEKDEFVEKLKVECYNKYKNKKDSGVKMIFTMKENGDVNLKVDELNLSYLGIYNYNMDYWLHILSDELEKCQLEIFKTKLDLVNKKYYQFLELLSNKFINKNIAEGNDLFKHNDITSLCLIENNSGVKSEMYPEELKQLEEMDKVWINKFNGSLNFYKYKGEFNLNESFYLLKLNKIARLLDLRYSNYDLFAVNNIPQTSVKCPVCTMNSEMSSKGRDVHRDHSKVNPDEIKFTVKEEFQGKVNVKYVDMKYENVEAKLEAKQESRIKKYSQIDICANGNDKTVMVKGEIEKEEEDIDNSLASILLNNNKMLMYNSSNNVHIVALYQVYPLYTRGLVGVDGEENYEESYLGISLALKVLVHDYVVINNSLVVFDSMSNMVGTVELGCLYQPSMKESLLNLLFGLLSLEFLNPSLRSETGDAADAHGRYFVTDPVESDLKLVTFRFNDLKLSLTFRDGLFYKANRDNQEFMFKTDQHPNVFISNILSQHR